MIFCMKIDIKGFYKQIVSFLVVIASNAQSIQNSKFVIFFQYIKKEGRNEVDFLHADNLSNKLILLILGGMARHAQITQNNKFAKYFQYAKILHFRPKFGQN